MATYTQFVGDARIDAAFNALGDAPLLPVGVSTSSSLSLSAQGVQVTLGGSNLRYDSINGEFTAGTVNTLEVRYQNGLLFRFDGVNYSATALNSIDLYTAGLGGNDLLVGSGESDILFGSEGSDTYRAGAGNDEMNGTPGGDLYDGGAGLDKVFYSGLAFNQVTITQQATTTFQVRVDANRIDTLVDVETAVFSDRNLSLLEYALGTPVAPDAKGTQVYRFAKVASGQYFYTGSAAERDGIIGSLPGFRYEGPVFNAQDNWVTGYSPVYRFANLSNGGYFYTASAGERDLVLSDYPQYRYEGASFYVPSAAGPDTVPVYRLANVQTGGYLFTTSTAERQFANTLGFFRDEGIAFHAPATIALSAQDDGLAAMPADELSAYAGASGADWLI